MRENRERTQALAVQSTFMLATRPAALLTLLVAKCDFEVAMPQLAAVAIPSCRAVRAQMGPVARRSSALQTLARLS